MRDWPWPRGSMERVEADLGLFMDRVVADDALVGGSSLRMSEDTSEARSAPLRYGIVRRTALTRVRLVWLTQGSQFVGFLKAEECASSVAFLTPLVISDRGICARTHSAGQEPLL